MFYKDNDQPERSLLPLYEVREISLSEALRELAARKRHAIQPIIERAGQGAEGSLRYSRVARSRRI